MKGDAACRECAEQPRLGDEARDDESKLYDTDKATMAGVMPVGLVVIFSRLGAGRMHTVTRVRQ